MTKNVNGMVLAVLWTKASKPAQVKYSFGPPWLKKTDPGRTRFSGHFGLDMPQEDSHSVMIDNKP